MKLKILSSRQITENTPEEDFLPFFLGNTPEEAERNYWKFSKLLNKLTASYHKFSQLDRNDLFGTAVIGLARALRDYEKTKRNYGFFAYALYRIKSALNAYCCANRSIVSVPLYILQAYKYINKLRLIIFGETDDEETYEKILSKEIDIREANLSKQTKQQCAQLLQSLTLLAKNNDIKYNNLIRYAEYIPLNIEFDEKYIDDNVDVETETKQLHLARIVSILKDKMDPIEKSIADGILSGKTYEEIGAAQSPPQPPSWVRKRLDKLRDKLLREHMDEILYDMKKDYVDDADNKKGRQ